MKLRVENDGIDHINVYSKGKTELGRFLSNFAYSPIKIEDGNFNSIEGYWYWLSCKDEKLRNLYGYYAKQYGRSVGGLDWQDSEEFKNKICKAIDIKINNNPSKLQELNNLKIPLVHYYNYGGRIIEPKEGKWIIEHISKYIGSCVDCGAKNNSVKYIIDPYIDEIYNKKIYKNLCRDCYRESCLDI